MSRIFEGNTDVTNCVTPRWMPRLLEVLNQWHEAQRANNGLLGNNEHFDEREEKHAHVSAKYTRLDVGTSGAWMLENATGDIFGIKAYGQINRAKCVGNISDPDFNGARLFVNRFRHGKFDFRRTK